MPSNPGQRSNLLFLLLGFSSAIVRANMERLSKAAQNVARKTILGATIAATSLPFAGCGNANTEPTPPTPTPTASTSSLEPDPCLPAPTDVKAAPTGTPTSPTIRELMSQDYKFAETYNSGDWKQGGDKLMRYGARDYRTRIYVTSEPVNVGTTLEDASKNAVEQNRKTLGSDKIKAQLCPSKEVDFNGYKAIGTNIISPIGVYGSATQARSTEYDFIGKNGRVYSVIFSAESSVPAFYNGEEQKAQEVLGTIHPIP